MRVGANVEGVTLSDEEESDDTVILYFETDTGDLEISLEYTAAEALLVQLGEILLP